MGGAGEGVEEGGGRGLRATTGVAEKVSGGNHTLFTHFPQMSIEQRLQGCPRQNNPNLLFMQEKQSRP